MTAKGFAYHAPPKFILLTGPLPELAAPESYGSELISRAGGVDLDEFRTALKSLSGESRFPDFFASKKELLATSIGVAVSEFAADDVSRWLREFYGLSGAVEYDLVFAPAMFRGNYGAHRTQGGTFVSFMVLSDTGYSTVEPRFSGVTRLALHEFGHSFVNPAVDANLGIARAYGLEELYAPVEQQMTAQAYGRFAVFLDEQLLRGTVILGCEAVLGDTDRAQRIAAERAQGFYLTDFTVQALDYYQQNRSTYATFAAFVPRLFQEYRDHKAELLTLAPQ